MTFDQDPGEQAQISASDFEQMKDEMKRLQDRNAELEAKAAAAPIMTLSIFIPIVPPKATSQGAGKRIVVMNGRPMFFKNKKAQGAENDLTLLLSQHKPAEALPGPLAVHFDFVFPWRASEPRKRIALGRVPHTTRPDGSNLVKMIEDIMTKLQFWGDDAQVSDLRVTKAWGDRVGITIHARPDCGVSVPLDESALDFTPQISKS